MKQKNAFFIVFVLCIFTACIESNEGPVTRNIKYEVAGTASHVHITMKNSDGNTEYLNSVPVPWKRTFKVTIEEGDSFSVYILAQNKDVVGSVTVKIYVDNWVFKSETSNEANAIAIAYGDVKGNPPRDFYALGAR